MHKDIRSLMKKLLRQDWRWEQCSRHYRAIPPDPTMPIIVISCTPSGSSWLNKVCGDLRRAGAAV